MIESVDIYIKIIDKQVLDMIEIQYLFFSIILLVEIVIENSLFLQNIVFFCTHYCYEAQLVVNIFIVCTDS